jgi:hypothetical protein
MDSRRIVLSFRSEHVPNASLASPTTVQCQNERISSYARTLQLRCDCMRCTTILGLYSSSTHAQQTLACPSPSSFDPRPAKRMAQSQFGATRGTRGVLGFERRRFGSRVVCLSPSFARCKRGTAWHDYTAHRLPEPPRGPGPWIGFHSFRTARHTLGIVIEGER